MIDYQQLGIVPAKHHIQFPKSTGSGVYYEECFTRDGFDGAYSILYHAFHTTDDVELRPSNRGWSKCVEAVYKDQTLKRRLYYPTRMSVAGDMLDTTVPVLFNGDLSVLFSKPTRSDQHYFSNGDGDELAFIYQGSGKLETSFGWLPFTVGDYVWIPKGTIHRWHFDASSASETLAEILLFEAYNGLHIPRQFRNPSGQLRMDAPYCHRDFVRPTELVWSEQSAQTQDVYTVVYKRREAFSERTMHHHPLDVVGWDGSVYPVVFPIEKYQPKTGLVHLPPTSHLTFAGDGFIVCSFVPRVVDFHPQAIPCPYPHTSVDCDELILYVRGNFTSRKGVGPGAMSLHPAGIPHGPHPGAYERSFGAQRTDELAVMIDTFKPLIATPNALAMEASEYHNSWRTT